MNAILRVATACAAILCTTIVNAQEISEAGYVGGLQGAIQACTEVFPEKASVYKGTLYRSVECHLSPDEAAQWERELRTSSKHGAQYQQAYVAGKAEVVSAPASVRKQMCASIERTVCHANSPPSFRTRK